MLLIVFDIVSILLIVLGIAACFIKNSEGKTYKKLALISVLGGLLMVGANSVVVIPTGYSGVQITFGQVSETTLGSGIHLKAPFIQTIEKVNCKQQDRAFDGQVWSEASDRTALYYEGITVTYQISADKTAWICSNVTDYEDNLVSSRLVSSALKSASKELGAEDATNRGKIEPLAMEKIQESLDEKYGEGVVTVNKVVITSADYEDSYNEAIAAKQTAQLALEKAQIENQQKVETAEADAKVKTTAAQAEADAAVIEAQGQAEANELLNESLTDRVLQEQYLEKWDGALPKVQMSDDGNVMVGIGNLTEEETETEAEP